MDTPPVHAARLLGDLGAAAAVVPMLSALASTSWAEILHDAILTSLPKIGAPVVEPALRLLAETDEQDVRGSVRSVLSQLGIRDERIRDALTAELEDDIGFAAMHLANYGDASVLPHLRAAFDREPISHERAFANQGLIELKDAIEHLGGKLTLKQQEKFEAAMEVERSMRGGAGDDEDEDDAGIPARVEKKPGRNERTPQ